MIEGEDGIYSSGEGNGCHRRELSLFYPKDLRSPYIFQSPYYGNA